MHFTEIRTEVSEKENMNFFFLCAEGAFISSAIYYSPRILSLLLHGLAHVAQRTDQWVRTLIEFVLSNSLTKRSFKEICSMNSWDIRGKNRSHMQCLLKTWILRYRAPIRWGKFFYIKMSPTSKRNREERYMFLLGIGDMILSVRRCHRGSGQSAATTKFLLSNEY